MMAYRMAVPVAAPSWQDLDGGHVERVAGQLDMHPGERRVGFASVPVQGDGGGLGDLAPLRP
jgi:hypothetical protein